jgi:hypothetical protein
MKTILLSSLLGLISLSAYAETEASLDYLCELNGQTRTGTVAIETDLVNGAASCMSFGGGKTICWRFERHVKIHDIYLALRFEHQLRADLDDNFIQLGNIPPAEGATDEIAVKMGLFRTKRLVCTFTNVLWRK